LRGLLGEGAPLSASSIARLKAGWQAEYDLWKTRSVAELGVVYLWVDGVYVKAGLEKDKAAILVVLAALRDGQKVILAVIWKTLLIAEKMFRRLDAPELLADVARGDVYVNGVRAVNRRDDKAAA
jgi:hypothetical protein